MENVEDASDVKKEVVKCEEEALPDAQDQKISPIDDDKELVAMDVDDIPTLVKKIPEPDASATASRSVDQPEVDDRARQLHEAAVRDMELRRKMRMTVVPTNVDQVKKTLRYMDEPITLFGEKPDERRNRLRRILAEREDDKDAILDGALGDMAYVQNIVTHTITQKERFFTKGPKDLEEVRKEILLYSLRKAAARLDRARADLNDADGEVQAEIGMIESDCRVFEPYASHFVDGRPLTSCSFCPGGGQLAVGSSSGKITIISVPELKEVTSFRAHDYRVIDVAWHPQAEEFSDDGLDADVAALVTSSIDCTPCLWSAGGKMVQKLVGHTHRIGRVAFHPQGNLLGSASFDGTWRLWDVNRGVSLLEQEGHSRAVYSLSFHGDGSLAASGGLDANVRVWDIRTGRSIMTLIGHLKSVLSGGFAPDGYRLVTGSEDHSVRVWDLRKKGLVHTWPAHESSVTQVSFEPYHGAFVATCSFDRRVRLWSLRDFALLKTLEGHEGHVSGVGVCTDGSNIVASVSQDRTVKLWAKSEFADQDAMET